MGSGGLYLLLCLGVFQFVLLFWHWLWFSICLGLLTSEALFIVAVKYSRAVWSMSVVCSGLLRWCQLGWAYMSCCGALCVVQSKRLCGGPVALPPSCLLSRAPSEVGADEVCLRIAGGGSAYSAATWCPSWLCLSLALVAFPWQWQVTAENGKL